MGIIAKSRAFIEWLPDGTVPDGGSYEIFKNDGAGGAVSYAKRINRHRIEAWPGGQGKYGDGLGRWGQEALGFEDGGEGKGLGEDGIGPAGFDDLLLSHTTVELDDGADYDFAVVAVDEVGNSDSPGEVVEGVVLAGTPAAASDFAADSYVSGTDTLTLTWTLSTDDEG